MPVPDSTAQCILPPETQRSYTEVPGEILQKREVYAHGKAVCMKKMKAGLFSARVQIGESFPFGGIIRARKRDFPVHGLLFSAPLNTGLLTGHYQVDSRVSLPGFFLLPGVREPVGGTVEKGL
jgi:hypothetical protein